MHSPAELVALADDENRERMLAGRDLRKLRASWDWWARPEQIGPEFRTADRLPSYAHDLILPDTIRTATRIWAVITGRGWGKTRTGSEWVIDRAVAGLLQRGALIGTTAAHARDVMVEGASGLGEVAERRKVRYRYEPSKRRVTLQPRAGRHSRCTITVFTAEAPELLAGPEHDSVWGDEFGGWSKRTDGAGRTAWDNAVIGMRLGRHPQACLTTTPRATELVKALLDPAGLVENGGTVFLTAGTIFDNPYLPSSYLEWIAERYAGTRLGQQELLGVLIEALGAYFSRSWFDDTRADGADRWMTTAEWERLLTDGDLVAVRYWDLAATEDTGSNDPDWTAGSLLAWDLRGGRQIWADCRMTRSSAGSVQELVKRTALDDPPGTIVCIEQDPGQAGKSQVAHYRDNVLGPLGIVCRPFPPSGSKETRATLPSTEAEAGRLWIVRSDPQPGDLQPWWSPALDQCEEFPDSPHDDIVDTLSGGTAVLYELARGGGQPVGSTTTTERLGPVGYGGSSLL